MGAGCQSPPKAPTSAALPSNDCALMRIFSLGPGLLPTGHKRKRTRQVPYGASNAALERRVLDTLGRWQALARPRARAQVLAAGAGRRAGQRPRRGRLPAVRAPREDQQLCRGLQARARPGCKSSASGRGTFSRRHHCVHACMRSSGVCLRGTDTMCSCLVSRQRCGSGVPSRGPPRGRCSPHCRRMPPSPVAQRAQRAGRAASRGASARRASGGPLPGRGGRARIPPASCRARSRVRAACAQEGQAQRAGGPPGQEQGAQGAGGRDGDRAQARHACRRRRAAPARQGGRRHGCARTSRRRGCAESCCGAPPVAGNPGLIACCSCVPNKQTKIQDALASGVLCDDA